jgi:hypothetical protein
MISGVLSDASPECNQPVDSAVHMSIIQEIFFMPSSLIIPIMIVALSDRVRQTGFKGQFRTQPGGYEGEFMQVFRMKAVAGIKKPPNEGRLHSCSFPPPALSGSGSTVGLRIL